MAEAGKVLELIDRIRARGLPVLLISHNMPHVFDIADRIHVHRLGRRVGVVSPRTHDMSQVVGLITGALEAGQDGALREVSGARRRDGRVRQLSTMEWYSVRRAT